MEGGGYNVRESPVLPDPERLGQGRQSSSHFLCLQSLLREDETKGCVPALFSCLFKTPGQDQLSGGLHHHMGHRHSDSVLYQGWQRRA